VSNPDISLASAAFSVFIRALVLAGPAAADAAVGRLVFGGSQNKIQGRLAVNAVCAFVDGGEGALRMMDAASRVYGARSVACLSGGLLDVVAEAVAELDSVGARALLIALDRLAEVAEAMLRAPDKTREPVAVIDHAITEALSLSSHANTVLAMLGVSVDDTGRCTRVGDVATPHELVDARTIFCQEFFKLGQLPRDLVGLSSHAQAALLTLRRDGFVDAIDSTVTEWLASPNLAMPKLGSSRDDSVDSASIPDGGIVGRVRRANIALGIIGGFAEIVRPGAMAITKDKSEVLVLGLERCTWSATVSGLPVTGRVSEISADDLAPLSRHRSQFALLPLLPFVKWHMRHGNLTEIDDSISRQSINAAKLHVDNGAFVRIRSRGPSASEDDPDSGGGWNRPRQMCLALRSLHEMLTHYSHDTADTLGADSELTDQLQSAALSLGNE
jgi:hypothetical protein